MSQRSVFTSLVFVSDHAGFALKNVLRGEAEAMGLQVHDLGTHSADAVDYPDVAKTGMEALISGQAEAGVFICGSGIGISMAANRHPAIRAAVCNDGPTAARMTRQHNNANVLCLGERLITPAVAIDTLKAFLSTPFEGGRHALRIAKFS
ncbi:MAG: ribose 5-phosphate isomerase B [Holosporales bacterium]